MGQNVSVEEAGQPGGSIADFLRSVETVEPRKPNWDDVGHRLEGKGWDREIRELMDLLKRCKSGSAEFDRERRILTEVAKGWNAHARRSACGDISENGCATMGRVVSTVLAAAVQIGFNEQDILFLFGGTEEGEGSSIESQQLLGKAVLHNATSAAIDVIVSSADSETTFVGLELASVLCCAQIFGVNFFVTIIDRHPRHEQLIARLVNLASAVTRSQAHEDLDREETQLATRVKSALEMLGAGNLSTPAPLNVSGTADEKHALTLLTILCAGESKGRFRVVLYDFCNGSRKGSEKSEGALVPFRTLYDALGAWSSDERGAIMCYWLLAGNKRFYSFAIARTDPETIVLPLLRLAVQSSKALDFSTTALIMCILLHLTELPSFAEALGTATISIKKHDMSETGVSGQVNITLAEVVISIALLSLRYLVVKSDNFKAYKLCIAVAANISEHLVTVNRSLAERMVRIVDSMIRRFARMKDQGADESQLEALTDVTALMLELIVRALKSCWSRSQFYTMLHQEHVFRSVVIPEKSSPAGAHLTAVAMRIQAFLKDISMEIKTTKAVSMEQILLVIEKTGRKTAEKYVKDLPSLHFRLEQIQEDSDFFKFYTWTITARHLPNKWDLTHALIN